MSLPEDGSGVSKEPTSQRPSSGAISTHSSIRSSAAGSHDDSLHSGSDVSDVSGVQGINDGAIPAVQQQQPPPPQNVIKHFDMKETNLVNTEVFRSCGDSPSTFNGSPQKSNNRGEWLIVLIVVVHAHCAV